jgi:hypothetical protein
MSAPLHIFYSYAHEDEELQRRLEVHLTSLKRQKLIDTWHSRDVLAGQFPREEIDAHLNSADIILLLISPDFLASDYCYGIEMKRALERHAAGDTMVIPIILRPTDWTGSPFAHLQALPRDGKPVTSWLNEDEAFADVAMGIRHYIEGLNQSQTPTQPDPTQSVSTNETAQSSSSASASMPAQNGATSHSAQVDVTTQTPASSLATSISSPQQASQVTFKAGAPDAMKAVTDKPIRRLSEDDLGFAIWIEALHKFITDPDTTTPLTIGVDGDWGTGKSSFMHLLQEELEPRFSFWAKWQKIRWPWLKWFGLFIATLPLWMVGKSIISLGSRVNVKRAWVQDIAAGLAYDPEIHIDTDLKALSRWGQCWARISAWRSPKQPVSHPTVWFDAWKFDQEEQLWAALALQIMNQIKQKYDYVGKIRFWLKLTRKRLSFIDTIITIVAKFALPLLIALIAAIYALFLISITDPDAFQHGYQYLEPFSSHGPYSRYMFSLLVIGFILSGFPQAINIIKDPFQIPLKKVFDKPNYKEKVGFIGDFQEDFSRIVSIITHRTFGWMPQKLVIFIDDLDRCKSAKAVDIIEGINVFLGSGQCVFVIGMDATAVTASIETKYQSMFEQMHKERDGIVSAGRLFLEKIIQVPLHVPYSTEKGMNSLVKRITKRRENPLQLPQTSTPSPRQGNTLTPTGGSGRTPTTQSPPTGPLSDSYTRKDVEQAIALGISLLPKNPRQVKRFINLLRLYIYMANEQELFVAENQPGLTMNRLAIWVVLSLRWGELIRHFSAEASLLASDRDLVVLIGKITKSLEPDGFWKAGPQSLYKDVPKDLSQNIQELQKSEERVKSHWCHLPWNLWFRNHDFLQCVQALTDFWEQPRPGEINWLHTMLLMTKVITPTTPIPTSNGNIPSTNQQNNGSIPSTNQQNNGATQAVH